MSVESKREELKLEGIAASPGVAHGPAFVILQNELEIPMFQIDKGQQARQIERFEQALMQTRQQILAVRAEVANRLGEDEAKIFDAHLMVLEDKALIEETIREVEHSAYNIEYSFHRVCQRFIEAFNALDDEYIKERVMDIRDVSRRLLHNLMGCNFLNLSELTAKRLLVSEDITPSDAAALEKAKVLGIVTNGGSRTSHAVIMARSLRVPAVVGLHDATTRIQQGDYLLIDGYNGIVIVNPEEQTLVRYGQLKEERQSLERVFEATAGDEALSLDGETLQLMANIGGPDDCTTAIAKGAAGVGLFRTEALFMQSNRFPTEEEQFQVYRRVASQMEHMPVVIRTLDMGGDKELEAYHFIQKENNPFMGFRAIRFCLEHTDVFKDQLRAILRATAFGNVKLMYPMISGVEELIRANELLDEAKKELKKRKCAFDDSIEVGSMIEIPGAAMTVDLLAEHCHFFSIGTNDLIQYLLAVDRVNDRIAHLYEPNHPAVIRTLAKVISEARKHELPVSVCGEMAVDPLYMPLLFGMGATELSVAPDSVPELKYFVRHMRMEEARELAHQVLKERTPAAIAEKLKQYYQRVTAGYSAQK